MSYVFEALILLVIFLGWRLLAHISEKNRERWRPVWQQKNARHSCCLDTPCSAECAQRRNTLMIAGAVDAVRGGEGFQALVRLAQSLPAVSQPPGVAAPRPGDRRDGTAGAA